MEKIKKYDAPVISNLPRGVRITRTGCAFDKSITSEEWERVGAALDYLDGAVLWCLGDWWAYGEHKYGDRAKAAGEGMAGYKYQTIRNAAWISEAFEMSRRRDKLPFSFHAEVAALEPEEQDALLDRAEKEGWTQRDLRREARRTKAKRQAFTAAELPGGKYRVIYADPPWEYGNEQPAYHTEQAEHYLLMGIDAISALPIKEISDDNAVLFLWVTSPILKESFQVIDAWGFEYKTSFVWDKVKHNMGHYNSVRHEFLLVCTKGSCTPDVQKLFDSVQTIERTKHSEKPEEFRKIIDTIYPNGKRIELFSRKKVDGWESFGNELPGL
jgi:N6-adenosine-specific RNA methylase IME4